MTCMIEASRNGHTRVAETLLNWHEVPVVANRTTVTSRPASVQSNRLKKVRK